MGFNSSSGSTVVTGDVTTTLEANPSKGDYIIISAVDGDNEHTVPVNKAWIVKNIVGRRANTGAINLKVNIDGSTYTLKEEAGTFTYLSGLNIRLKAGDMVSIHFGTGTTGNLQSYIVFEEYDA